MKKHQKQINEHLTFSNRSTEDLEVQGMLSFMKITRGSINWPSNYWLRNH